MPTSDNSVIKVMSVNQISAKLLPEYTPGYLMNRDRLGIPLRQEFMRCLTEIKEGQTLAVDFSGIDEMTTSVAEEIGPKLFEAFLTHWTQANDNSVYLTYCNVSTGISRGLDGAFKSWQSRPNPAKHLTTVAFQTYQGGKFVKHQFLGEGIPDALKDALDLIYRLGQTNSSDLQERGIRAASRKLNELFSQYPWLLRRSQKSIDVEPRAWAYFYYPIVPMIGTQG